MKKLVIALTAVVLGIAANAATVNWTATGVAEYGKATAAASSLGYIGVLIDASITDRDTMLAKFANQDTSLVAGATIANSQGTVGILQGQSFNGYVSVTGAGNFGNSVTVNAYALIFDAATVADAKHVYVTDVLSKTTGANGQAANFSFGALTGTQTASNWVAVPEPTSGLLLLLGMAGLALRRKQK